MKRRLFLFADDGEVVTNGTEYGTTICLAENVTEAGYYEITEEEYKNRTKPKENSEG